MSLCQAILNHSTAVKKQCFSDKQNASTDITPLNRLNKIAPSYDTIEESQY